MVMIDKDEAMYLRNRFKWLNVVRTMKAHSDRHRYYVEESDKVMNALKQYRGKKGGARR